MEPEEFEEELRNMKTPTVDVSQHQQQFKIALLNTRKSATLGLLLLLSPLMFLWGVVFKHYLKIDLGIITFFYSWTGSLPDDDSSILSWMIRFLLLGGPPLAIALNLLAILHFSYDRKLGEVNLSIKLKWLNIAIILVCSLLFTIFFLYLIVENAGH